MRTARRFALAAASMALLLGAHAQAEPKFGIEGWGSWNRHSMADVNDTLSSFNREYQTALAPIHHGGSWGLALRAWPREDVVLRLGFERLSARSQDSGVEFDLGANAITLSATRFLPSSSPIRYGLGLGLGPLRARGRLVARRASLETSGWGFGGHVTGEADVPIGGGCTLNGVVGYRLASIGELEIGDNTSDLSANYSGFFVRVGLAMDFQPEP